MNKRLPVISIIIPVFDNLSESMESLEITLESLSKQTHVQWEAIIVSDQNCFRHKISTLKSKKIQVYTTAAQVGLNALLKIGTDLVYSKYFAIVYPGDKMLSNFLTRLIRCFESHKSPSFIWSAGLFKSKKGNTVVGRPLPVETTIKESLMTGNGLCVDIPFAVKMSCYKKTKGFDACFYEGMEKIFPITILALELESQNNGAMLSDVQYLYDSRTVPLLESYNNDDNLRTLCSALNIKCKSSIARQILGENNNE